jgi:hypothetical protein
MNPDPNAQYSIGEMISAFAALTLKNEFRELQATFRISDQIIQDLVASIRMDDAGTTAAVYLTKSNSVNILKELDKLPMEALSYSVRKERKTLNFCGVERVVDSEVYILGSTSAKFAMNFPVEAVDFARSAIEGGKLAPKMRVSRTERWYVALVLAFILKLESSTSMAERIRLNKTIDSLRQQYARIQPSHQNYKIAAKSRTSSQKQCFLDLKNTLKTKSANTFVARLRELTDGPQAIKLHDLLSELNIKEIEYFTRWNTHKTRSQDAFEIFFAESEKIDKLPIIMTKRYICDQFNEVSQNA